MQIVVHVNGFNDWVPVPDDVDKKSPKFKKAITDGTVKETMNGGYSMKVPKTLDTHVAAHLQEEDLIQCAIQEMTRGDRQYLTRGQCITRMLARHVLPNEIHPTHVEEFQISQDDGPDWPLFHKLITEHVECGNLSELDVEPMTEAYKTSPSADEQHDALHAHFKVKPEKLAAFRAKREATENFARTAAEKFHAARAAALTSITPVQEKVSK